MKAGNPMRAAMVVLALVAAACSGDVETPAEVRAPDAPTKEGGTVTVAAEQFPSALNTKLQALAWTNRTTGPALARGYLLTPDLTYRPWLFADDCTVASTVPFTVSCRIRPEARWSDGTDLTAEDFKFTAEVINDARNKVTSREGFDKIQSFTVKGSKAFDMVFTEPRPAFRDMWTTAGGATLPRHVLGGKDFNTVWNQCICDPSTRKPIGSGPFLVESFTPATGPLVLARNEAYWGERPKLDRIVFTPIADTDTTVNTFRSGGVDVIFPTTQIGLREKIAAVENSVYQSKPGTSWEHFDMRTDVPGLDDPEVRRAVATALPRAQIVDRLVKPADDQARVLNNVFYMTGQPEYKPHWSIYPENGDPVAASRILERAGYRKGNDGIYAKDRPLRFTIGVNADRTRELAQEIIKAQLEQAGIRLDIANAPDMISQKRIQFDFQTIIYAWTGAPDPIGGSVIWREDTIPENGAPGLNFTKLRHPKVTELIKRADRELDPRIRADLYNQADDLLAREGISSVPLFQKPQPLAFTDRLVGLEVNPTIDSFTWNVERWAFRS